MKLLHYVMDQNELNESIEEEKENEINDIFTNRNLQLESDLRETKLGDFEEDKPKKIVSHKIVKDGISKKIVCEIEFDSNKDVKILNNTYDYQFIKKKKPILIFDFLESKMDIFND